MSFILQDDSKPVCSITDVKPSVENVIPFNRYKRTQPEINGVPMFSVPACDQHLLLAGGRNLVFSLLHDQQNTTIENVELFILNMGLVLWFNSIDKGLQVPYETIIYHGSLKSDDPVGHQLSLIITLETDPVLLNFFNIPPPHTFQNQAFSGLGDNLNYSLHTLEITLRPKYSLYDRHYNEQIESLFTFMDFGVNRGDNMIENCNQQLAVCLENISGNESSEEDAEDEKMSVGQDDNADTEAGAVVAPYAPFSEALNTLDNSGLADDLDISGGAAAGLYTRHY